MNNEFRILKQTSSIAIANTILSLPNQQIIDKEALKIILFATEEGLGCRNTAMSISLTIADSDDINQDMFLMIKDLENNTYFHPTTEISTLIEKYFKQIGDKFNFPEDLELYGELITDVDDPNQPRENLL